MDSINAIALASGPNASAVAYSGAPLGAAQNRLYSGGPTGQDPTMGALLQQQQTTQYVVGLMLGLMLGRSSGSQGLPNFAGANGANAGAQANGNNASASAQANGNNANAGAQANGNNASASAQANGNQASASAQANGNNRDDKDKKDKNDKKDGGRDRAREQGRNGANQAAASAAPTINISIAINFGEGPALAMAGGGYPSSLAFASA